MRVQVDQMSAFAVVLLESNKCLNLGSGSKNTNKEMDTRDILKEREINKI